LRACFIAVSIVMLSTSAYAENWIDFHTEKWKRKSGKTSEKLLFCNRYYYDADSLVKTASGNVTLWVKVISDNDKFYVKKGVPLSEAVYQKVHIWCALKRYEVLQADINTDGPTEVLSEEIKNGSYYEKLYKSVCNSGGH